MSILLSHLLSLPSGLFHFISNIVIFNKDKVVIKHKKGQQWSGKNTHLKKGLEE